MIFNIVDALYVTSYTWLYDVHTNDATTIRDRKGRINPAISIHHVGRYFIDNAINRIADILSWGYKQGERDQYDHGCFVVQSEDIIVDAHTV